MLTRGQKYAKSQCNMLRYGAEVPRSSSHTQTNPTIRLRFLEFLELVARQGKRDRTVYRALDFKRKGKQLFYIVFLFSSVIAGQIFASVKTVGGWNTLSEY